MKKAFLHSIHYILVANILFASLGVVQHTRHCEMPMMEDETRLFQPPSKCCEKAKKTPCSEKNPNHPQPIDPCCDFSIDFIKGEFEGWFVSNLDLSPDFQVWPLPSEAYPLFPNFLSFEVTPRYFSGDSSPPEGPPLFILHQSFLI
ncbi:MAG: hypothetical protein AAFU64_05575 [Bacteroidota bacterium]